MNDIDRWIHVGGSEPEPIRAFLDALRDVARDTGGQGAEGAPVLRDARYRAFAEGEPSVKAGAPSARSPGERQVGEGGLDRGDREDRATVRSPTFEERPAAPPPAEPSPPLLPVDAWAPRPSVTRAPEAMTITSVALEIPAELRAQIGRLPFKPRAQGNDLARTMKVPVMNRYQGKTAPLGDDLLTKAVAVLPFVGNTIGTGVVPFPRLSLEQYASLRAELSMWPERSAEILRRYSVMNEAARRALEEHWQMQLAASPEACVLLQKAFAEYTAWLRTRSA